MSGMSALAIRRRTLLAAGAASLAAGRAQAAQVRIGAVIWARDSQYWQQVEKGMRDAAAQRGAAITLAINNRQLATETQVSDDLVTRGIDALILSPIDVTATAAMVRRVVARGITVVQYNTFLKDTAIPTYDIGVDNVELGASVGREAARHIRADLGGKATLGLISLPPINAGSAPRRQGFMAALQDVQVTLIGETTGSTPEQGANGLETLLQRDPGVQIVMGANAGSIAGAATASRRMHGSAKLYGIDMSRELADMMLDPGTTLEAVSDQQPYRIGYLSVEAAVNAREGRQQPRQTTVPTKLYTRARADELHAYLDFLKSLNS
ncbi:MAG: sugar ABC transporter substrate-binding protein [Rhodospirillales bacterium]|nr:sugar ABC transporter substrate-binding protein [Rhodospirillales bacterium]